MSFRNAFLYWTILTLCVATCTFHKSEAATKFAGDFLAFGAGARALGMGGAFVAVSDDATAVYWNPAGLTQLRKKEAIVMHSERFGGEFKYDLFGVALPIEQLGGVGINVVRVGSDDIKFTELPDPSEEISGRNRPRVSKIVSNTDYGIFLSNGRRVFTDLSLGGSIKFITRSIGDNTAFGYGIDIGVLYTSSVGFSIGLNLADVTSTKITWDTGAKDKIEPSLILGAAYTWNLPFPESKITGAFSSDVGGESSSGIDTGTNNSGVEYWYRDTIAIRAGFQGGNLTAGAGLRLYRKFGLDLAFLSHDDLDNTYPISASLQF